MNAVPKDTTILLTEAIMNPLANREKLMELIFEHFQFSKATIQIQAILSLYADGLSSAMLLDSGDGVTHLIPIYEGQILKPFISRLNLAGRHITSYLLKLLFMKYFILFF